MATKPSTPVILSPSLAASLDERLLQLKDQIAERAGEIANATVGPNATPLNPVDLSSLSMALDEATKGRQNLSEEGKPRFFELFPPFTCVCAVLCLAFATLGLLPLIAADPAVAAKATASASGFLDIAKIFAGAIVGSTTSIALASSKAKRGA